METVSLKILYISVISHKWSTELCLYWDGDEMVASSARTKSRVPPQILVIEQTKISKSKTVDHARLREQWESVGRLNNELELSKGSVKPIGAAYSGDGSL